MRNRQSYSDCDYHLLRSGTSMRPVYNGNWSPRSRDQPIHSQHAAYSRPTGAHQSRYGDNFDNNLSSVEDLGPLQQYLGSYNDPNVEANIPSFLQFTNSLADDQGIWLPTPQSHSEYNGVLSHSIARPSGTNQTGGETAGPQQALPGTYVVFVKCTITFGT